MDNTLPDPKPFNPPTQPAPTNSNPYDTEIPPESIEHTPERPNPLPATNPLMSSPRIEMPAYHSDPPSAEQVRSNDLPHKPHHFVTKKALILGLLFIVTAALSSIITFALVGSRAQKTPETPITRIYTPTIEQMTEYSNKSTGLTFIYPTGWAVAEKSKVGDSLWEVAITKGTLSLNLFVGPIGVDGACMSDPLLDLGSEPVTAFGKSLNLFFQGDSTTQQFASAYITEQTTPCPNKGFVDITDLKISQDRPEEPLHASINIINEANPLLETFRASTDYQEIKTIINSLEIKSPVTDISQPSNSDSTTACTMDAKVCPDGSSVGRIPPSCEFEACP